MNDALARFCPAALPDAPAILVIHSWWGLTPSFHHYAEALAAGGCHVGLVDLYGGAIATDEAEAAALRRRPRRTPVYRQLLAALADLSRETGQSRLGVVGFSIGGHWAVWLSQHQTTQINATILYYAARGGDFSASTSSYLAHFAETDPWVRPSARTQMERALIRAKRPYQSHDYVGTTHWFAESSSASYNAHQAQLALQRDISFLCADGAP